MFSSPFAGVKVPKNHTTLQNPSYLGLMCQSEVAPMALWYVVLAHEVARHLGRSLPGVGNRVSRRLHCVAHVLHLAGQTSVCVCMCVIPQVYLC